LDACLKFSQIKQTKNSLSGCIDIEIGLAEKKLIFKFGCFSLSGGSKFTQENFVESFYSHH